MKKSKKGLFATLIVALLLTVAIPTFAAFAGNENDVFGTESNSDVGSNSDFDSDINTDLVAGADADICYYYLSVSFNVGFYDMDFANRNDKWFNFNDPDNTVSITIPECSNSANTFLYWRDRRTGKIYHPGDLYTINTSIDDFEDSGFDDNIYYASYDFSAIWQGDTLKVDSTANLYLMLPAEDVIDGAVYEGDGLNKYSGCYFVETTIKGTYNLKNNTFSLEKGHNNIQIPTDKIPTFGNYKFKEWNTKSDGSGKGYQPGDYVEVNETTSSLYAIFDGYTKSNVVEIYASEWRLTDSIDVCEYWQYLQYDENGVIAEFTAPPALTNKIGEFSHWYNYKNGKSYYPGQTYYNINVDDFAYISDYNNPYYIGLVAVWKSDEIYIECEGSVYFNFESGFRYFDIPVKGTYNFNSGKYTFEGEPSFTIPKDLIPDNEKEYTFLGWNTSEYGSGTTYKPGDTVKFTEDDIFINLYAFYESENDFMVENSDSTVTVKEAEPMIGLVLRNDVSIDEVTMVVSNLAEAAQDAVLEALKKEVEGIDTSDANYSMVDIHLEDRQGKHVEVEDGRIKVIIGYPDITNAKDYNYTVYHYVDGALEAISVEKQDNGLAFFADSFSPYALVWTEESTNEPSNKPPVQVTKPSNDPSKVILTNTNNAKTDSPGTGDNFNPVIFIVLAVMSAVAIGSVLILRKRKESAK